MINYQALALLSAYDAEVHDEEGLGQAVSVYDDLKAAAKAYADVVPAGSEEVSPALAAPGEGAR